MKKIFLSFVLFALAAVAWSQTGKTVNAFQVRGNAYPLGLGIELADSDTKTINVSFGVMGSLATVGNTDEDTSLAFGFAPYIDVQYRWFYTLKREAKKGMKLRGNSGNFLALRVEAKSNPVYDVFGQATSRLSAGAIWGLQRQYSTGFHLGFDLGFGYAVDSDFNAGFAPMGNIKIGWILLYMD